MNRMQKLKRLLELRNEGIDKATRVLIVDQEAEASDDDIEANQDDDFIPDDTTLL